MILYNIILYIIHVLLCYVIILLYYMFIIVFIYCIIIVCIMIYNITWYNMILLKRNPFVVHKNHLKQCPKMDQKWTQNGPKMGPKWPPKWTPKWIPSGTPFSSLKLAISSLKVRNPRPRTESASLWRVDQKSFTSAYSVMRSTWFVYIRNVRYMNACIYLRFLCLEFLRTPRSSHAIFANAVRALFS